MKLNYTEPYPFRPIPTITPVSSYWENGTWKFNMSEITAGGASQPSWIDIILSGNTALTLTNALANGLNYLKLFGGTEQRNLPSEYTQVEYLGGTRNAYANLGAITIEPTDTLYCECILLNNGKILFGSSDHTRCYIAQAGNGTSAFAGTSYSVPLETWIVDGTTVNTIELTSSKFTINGVDFTPTGTASSDICSSFGINTIINATSGYDTSVSYIKKFYIKSSSGNYKVNLTSCRNTNNVFGYYDTVSQTFFTNQGTGTFTAGSDVTPTPDTPMDIVSNNGVIKVSKNLFDYEYFYDNYQTYSPSAVGRCPIKLQPNTTYTVSTNKEVYSTSASMFVVSGNAIDWAPNSSNNGVLVNRPRTVTTDSNGYLCFGLYVASENAIPESDFINGTVWVQIEQGSSATSYMPYGQIYTDGTTETVNVHGKNLYNDATRIDGYFISSTGVITASANSSYSALIPVKQNATYTFSGVNSATVAANKRLHAYDSNGVWLEQLNFVNNIETNMPFAVTTTTTAQTAYVRISFATPDSNIQLELGSTATTYEPYFNGGTATAEMLLKVGDYQDEQSVLDGGVTRNVGIKVLDGSEDWKATYQGFFEAPLPDHITSAPAYCNYFQSVTTGTVPPAAERANKVWLGSTWVGLGATTKFSTVDTFKQWLADQYNAGTPVIVVYPLAEPTTETVTGQPLTTQAGTNIVSITQASIEDLELEVSFKQSTI